MANEGVRAGRRRPNGQRRREPRTGEAYCSRVEGVEYLCWLLVRCVAILRVEECLLGSREAYGGRAFWSGATIFSPSALSKNCLIWIGCVKQQNDHG